jgi:hypothetical protein
MILFKIKGENNMKYLIFILFFGFLFISQGDAFAQKKTKKIETYDVWGTVDYWYYCKDDNGNFDENCVDRVKIKFTNSSTSHLSKITFKLKIEVAGSTIYKKKHTINVDIDPDETIPYDIKLSGKVNGYQGQNIDDFRAEIEILSVK